MDPHSIALENCIDNLKKLDNSYLSKWAIEDLSSEGEDFKLVSPDAGALKKIFSTAKSIGYKDKVIVAEKVRDLPTGKIIHTHVPLEGTNPTDNFIIIDDICDGGRTFVEIAKTIKSHVWTRDEYFKGKIYLIVTHGIFSAGFEELGNYFDGIYSTNSISELDNSLLKQLNVF
jgi:ribose-phosphate pyrophosphokinase